MSCAAQRYWLLLGIIGCAGAPGVPPPVPALPPDQVVTSLYFIGDAGDPDPEGEPVLRSLRRELDSGGKERVVVFLGDNIYPRGLPVAGAPTRSEAERRLRTQLEAVTGSSATGYFVLGNHDWAKHGGDGWNAARRQEAFVDSLGSGRVVLLPGHGCPGPGVADVGDRIRLLFLDTQWWLHPGPKPEGGGSGCAASDDEQVIDSIRAAIRGAGTRLVVVVGHHPFATGGDHGGYFGWKDHLFPLRQLDSRLWIPLPLIGSLYPSARQQGISNQDLSSAAYRRFIKVLTRAFTERSPALYAAGHDHNLQVIAGGAARLELVSGGGIYGHTGRAVRVHGSLFARQASGFGRLDVTSSGRCRLAVVEVDREGNSHEAFSTWVE